MDVDGRGELDRKLSRRDGNFDPSNLIALVDVYSGLARDRLRLIGVQGSGRPWPFWAVAKSTSTSPRHFASPL